MRRLFSVFAFIFLLSLMGLASPLALTSNAQATSCPSNETFNWFEPGGTPTGFNYVSSPPTVSDFEPARFMYPGFSGFAFTNGTISLQDSIVSSVTHNANYTQWTFVVKPGLKWSNGQPVTAADILATYGPQFGLNASFDVFNFHAEVARTYAANTSTAVFVLNQSDAWFPSLAGANSFTGVYPVAFTQHGGAYSGINATSGTLVGNGPWYVSNYASGDTQMISSRNPYYTPAPKICQILWNFVESDAQDATYLIGGKADMALLEPGAVSSLSGHPDLHISDAPAVNNLFLGYNVSVFPYNQLAFRQALLYAMNQTEIQQKAFYGYETIAYNSEGGIPPQTTLWYTPHQNNYTYDPTKAVQLLNSIGFKKGSNGIMQYPNGTDVSLTIYAANEFEGNTLAAGVVQNDLQQNLGFNINIQSVSIGTLIGDSYQGLLQYGMQLFDSGGAVHGIPYLDALPEWNVYTPTAPYPVWEPTPQAEADYQGNYTCVKSSDLASVLGPCLNNIQAINSQQLPNIMLGYPDIIYGYSTARFTNWPTFILYGAQGTFNNLGMSQITPVGSVTTSTSTASSTPTGAPTTSSSSATQTGTGSATTSRSTSQATTQQSSSTTSSSAVSIPLGPIAIVIAMVLVASAIIVLRKPRMSASPSRTQRGAS